LWLQYSVPTDYETQKQLIRQLRTWIEGITEQRIIRGFAFDHYFNNPNEADHISIRFDYPTVEIPEVVTELQERVGRFVPNYSPHGEQWESDEEILKAYEFGSRCAFLFWELLSQGRFPENYTSDFRRVINQQHAIVKVPFNFQWHFNHGVMNSLSVPKLPNEQWIHMMALIESTGSKSPTALYKWLKKQPAGFFPRKKR
jgi:hypothetical protein